jgi:lipopolysaccharide transport protein LptA
MFKSSEKLLFIDVRAIVNADLEGKDVYNISSELGSYQIKNDKVVLEKNVSVSTSHGYKVLTDKLEYFAKTKKINSSDIVSISGKTPSGEQLSIEGIGINGDLGSGDFSIVKKISTKFGKNLMISSQHASFNTNKDVVVFEKDLVAKKDNLDIKGDKLVVKYVSTGEIKDIEVLGNVMIQAGDKKYALCDRAVMKDRSSQVELTGKPEFHVDKDIIVGQKIVFFADSDEVYVEKVKAEVSEQTVRKKK